MSGAVPLLIVAIGVVLLVNPTHRSGTVAVQPTTSPTSAPRSPSTGTVPSHSSSVLAIGDSVMEGSQGALQKAIGGVIVDAAISRRFDQAAGVVDEYKQLGPLPSTIVIHLGDNDAPVSGGIPTATLLDDVMDATGPQSTVYFLTVHIPRPWEGAVNNALRALVARRPNARLLDWRAFAQSHPDWFVNDGWHLIPTGQTAYATFIRDGIRNTPTHATTSVTDATSRRVPDYVTVVMARTAEVAHPNEHFTPRGSLVRTSDGNGGTIDAIIGIRTPSADGLGQLVFFFHNQVFTGWDADHEATSVLQLVASGPQTITVTYANQAAHDPVIGASLPPATITYRWDGHRIAPDTQPPAGIYGLNDPTANAIYVTVGR
jgi:hypothetical protein